MNQQDLKEVAKILSQSKKIVAFTGAGISVESGIPPFRGDNGIYNKYDPSLLEIDNYYSNTEASWKAIKAIFFDFLSNKNIRPNAGHEILAKWEKEGRLQCVITQNIDDLHRIAGSKTIYEFHGNSSRFVCQHCGKSYHLSEIEITDEPAMCKHCGHLLKPDFVFFGEGIPEEAYYGSVHAAESCDAFLIIGTSGQVAPANMIPYYAKRNGAKIIEINFEPSTYTHNLSDFYLEGKSGEILPLIDSEMRKF